MLSVKTLEFEVFYIVGYEYCDSFRCHQVRFNLVIPERIIAISSGRKKGRVGSKVTALTLSDEEEEAMLEEVEKTKKMAAVTKGRFVNPVADVSTAGLAFMPWKT